MTTQREIKRLEVSNRGETATRCWHAVQSPRMQEESGLHTLAETVSANPAVNESAIGHPELPIATAPSPNETAHESLQSVQVEIDISMGSRPTDDRDSANATENQSDGANAEERALRPGDPEQRDDYDSEALVAAAIIARRILSLPARTHRIKVADTAAAKTDTHVDLCHRGQAYRVSAAEIRPRSYRIGLDESSCLAEWSEGSAQVAVLHLAGKSLRVSYDASQTFLSVEVEGYNHRFSMGTGSKIAAGTSAKVLKLMVTPGDVVEVGQTICRVESMETEIAIQAPLAGTVGEVPVRIGQRVTARELLVAIEPRDRHNLDVASEGRIQLPDDPDALGRWLSSRLGKREGGDRERRPIKREVIEGLDLEIRHLVMGFELVPNRVRELLECLNNEDGMLFEDFEVSRLAELRHNLRVFADLERLFQRVPRTSEGGVLPSNHDCLRAYLLTIHRGDTGMDEEFRGDLLRAMTHYGVDTFGFDPDVEDTVSRILATRDQGKLRTQLMLALFRLIATIAESRCPLDEDADLESALVTIARMRDSLPSALLDAATATRYSVYERPQINALATRATLRVEQWLNSVELTPSMPTDSLLDELIDAPAEVFERIAKWLESPDPRLQAIAQSALLFRLYTPRRRSFHTWMLAGDDWIERVDLHDGRTVLCATCTPEELSLATRRLVEGVDKLCDRKGTLLRATCELFVTGFGDHDETTTLSWANTSLREHWPRDERSSICLTVSLMRAGCPASHRTFEIRNQDGHTRPNLLEIHPEAAARVELHRLEHFDLELVATRDDAYCIRGRAHIDKLDERLFVMVDVRPRNTGDDPEVDAQRNIEHAFLRSAELLREALRSAKSGRWRNGNRIYLVVSGSWTQSETAIESTLRFHAAMASQLGLERVCVRIPIRDAPDDNSVRVRELSMIEDVDGRTVTRWFTTNQAPIQPASAKAGGNVGASPRRIRLVQSPGIK